MSDRYRLCSGWPGGDSQSFVGLFLRGQQTSSHINYKEEYIMIRNILGDIIPNDVEPIGCACRCECPRTREAMFSAGYMTWEYGSDTVA